MSTNNLSFDETRERGKFVTVVRHVVNGQPLEGVRVERRFNVFERQELLKLYAEQLEDKLHTELDEEDSLPPRNREERRIQEALKRKAQRRRTRALATALKLYEDACG
jgi:hypothetical protein